MNCHECEFVGNVPGSVHRSCNILGDKGLEFLASTGAIQVNISDKDGSNERSAIEIDEYGKSMGWAIWPVNFDPTWIKKCAFFTNKTNKNEASIQSI